MTKSYGTDQTDDFETLVEATVFGDGLIEITGLVMIDKRPDPIHIEDHYNGDGAS